MDDRESQTEMQHVFSLESMDVKTFQVLNKGFSLAVWHPK